MDQTVEEQKNDCPKCLGTNAITFDKYDQRWRCVFCGLTSYTREGLTLARYNGSSE